MAWLTTEGAARQIDDGETVVGSGPHAAWRLVSHDLAARHFVVSKRGDSATICAAAVDAVVVVNGRQIGTHGADLHDDSVIDAGSGRFLYSRSKGQIAAASAIGPAHIIEARTGAAHPLTAQSSGIGRDQSNPIIVRDATASRFHAEVRREAGGYVLHPRGSSGTRLNGRPIGTPERLDDGDRIEIAHVEWRFALGEAPPGAPRPTRLDDEPTRSNRRTIASAAAMEIPREDAPSRSNLWIVVALVLVVVATLFLWFK